MIVGVVSGADCDVGGLLESVGGQRLYSGKRQTVGCNVGVFVNETGPELGVRAEADDTVSTVLVEAPVVCSDELT